MCSTCGKLLPAPALRAVFSLLRNIQTELAVPPPDTEDLRRFRSMQVAKARAQVEILLEEETHVCLGHERKKPGRKPAADPSDPRPPEEQTTTRKKRGAPALRAVADGDGGDSD